MSDLELPLRPNVGGAFDKPTRRIAIPSNSVTGQQRWELGADTPPELQAYGISNALMAYVTNKATGIEVGYFFIGVSNEMDGGADDRALVFGNVTYPIAGNPGSATMANVKTNFQMDQWTQNPFSIFKDHNVSLADLVSIIMSNGVVQIGGNGLTNSIGILQTGDANYRFRVLSNGKIEWGPGGGSTTDVNLYRTGTAEIGTDQNLKVRTHRVRIGEQDTELVSFAAVTSKTVAVSFATAFAAAPNVHCNINSGSGVTANWHARAINISTTGFTMFCFGPSNTWTNVPVQWTAVGN